MITLEKRNNLATRITERLFEAILRGELKPGERLIETKMARQLGVGQSTFREVLQALEHRGLVSKDRGSFVTTLTLLDVKLLFAVRLELEPLAASLACGRLTSAHLRQLKLHLNEMKEARVRRDFTMLLKNDLAFHQLIWEASQVMTLNRILNLVLPPLFAFFFTQNSHAFLVDPKLAEETFKAEHEDHCRLLTVLKEGDSERVKSTFREVIQHFMQSTLELPTEAGHTSLSA